MRVTLLSWDTKLHPNIMGDTKLHITQFYNAVCRGSYIGWDMKFMYLQEWYMNKSVVRR